MGLSLLLPHGDGNHEAWISSPRGSKVIYFIDLISLTILHLPSLSSDPILSLGPDGVISEVFVQLYPIETSINWPQGGVLRCYAESESTTPELTTLQSLTSSVTLGK